MKWHRPEVVAAYLDKVMLVTRLREVRALQGFSRILPAERARDPGTLASPSDPGWRPAIEVRGEGIFLVLGDSRLADLGAGSERCYARPPARPPLRSSAQLGGARSPTGRSRRGSS